MKAEEYPGGLSNITLNKRNNEEELAQLRFRDGDLSATGAALLGFSGLMFAADLVFLSAAPDSFIAQRPPFGCLGFFALFALAGASYYATWSIADPSELRTMRFDTALEFFNAVHAFHEQRRSKLATSRLLSIAGTIAVLLAIVASVVVVPLVESHGFSSGAP